MASRRILYFLTFTMYDTVFFLIESISCIIYTYVIAKILLSRNRKLRTTFFMIFVSSGVGDVSSAIVNRILRHIQTLVNNDTEEKEVNGLQQNCSLNSTIYLLSGLFFYSHFMGSLLVSANRFTAVVFPGSHHKIWCFHNCWLFILLQWMTAISCVSYRIGIPASYRVINITSEEVPVKVLQYDDPYSWIAHLVASSVCAIVALCCLGLTLLTLFYLFHIKKKLNPDGPIDKTLLVYSLFSFAGCTCMVAQQICRSVAYYTSNEALIKRSSYHYHWVNDVLIFTNLYAILLCSTHTRAEVFTSPCTNQLKSHRKSIIMMQQREQLYVSRTPT